MFEPVRGAITAALIVAERRPQAFAMATSAPMVVAGDFVAQQMELSFDGQPMGVDVRRCFSVLCWAIVYLGWAQYNIYTHMVDPVITVQRFGRRLTPLLKSVSCNLVVTPFINIPLYYIWSTTRLPIKKWDWGESARTLKREWKASSIAGVSLWGPAQWFNFAVVPTSLRIPFMSVIAFVWSLVISMQAQRSNIRPVRGGGH